MSRLWFTYRYLYRPPPPPSTLDLEELKDIVMSRLWFTYRYLYRPPPHPQGKETLNETFIWIVVGGISLVLVLAGVQVTRAGVVCYAVDRCFLVPVFKIYIFPGSFKTPGLAEKNSSKNSTDSVFFWVLLGSL